MCGICGIFGIGDKGITEKMCKALAHRGPDDQGIYIDKNISLGHRRLSIIDLSAGHQPIHNEDETIQVVFNGEIYNYKDLKSKLSKHHNFYTSSDTEVIVHLYEDLGENAFKLLNGMFSIAIWDSIKNQLVLARDPLGKKPLYYYSNGKVLLFSSEIKAIIEAGISKEIDFTSVCSHLAYGYTIGEDTIFRGIKKLLAGNYLIANGKKVSIKNYWDIEERIIQNNETYISKKLRSLLEESGKYRMIADVPVGAFLSGGLDSSTVVALTRPLADYDFHTFSLGFKTHSELKYARIVSDFLDTEHHEIVIDGDKVAKEVTKIAWHYDEPIGDAAVINNYFLAQEARKYVKVVVAGEGADEVFGGYQNYQTAMRFHKLFGKSFMKSTLERLNKLNPRTGDINKSKSEKGLYYLSQPNFEKFHLQFTRTMSDDEIRSTTILDPSGIDDRIIYPKGINNPLNKMLALDCKNLLPEKFLMKADKAIMANSIEERLPLMDKGVVEFAFTIPPELKIKNNQEKYILREAVKDLLPKEIINRKKQGFSTPTSDWMHGRLNEMVHQELYDNEFIRKCFIKEKIDKMVSQFQSKASYVDQIIWNIFALGLWYDVYFNS